MLMGPGKISSGAHRMRGWMHAALAVLILLLCPVSASHAAQVQPLPSPAVLTKVRLISESAEELRFELQFNPKATSFAPIASQPT